MCPYPPPTRVHHDRSRAPRGCSRGYMPHTTGPQADLCCSPGYIWKVALGVCRLVSYRRPLEWAVLTVFQSKQHILGPAGALFWSKQSKTAVFGSKTVKTSVFGPYFSSASGIGLELGTLGSRRARRAQKNTRKQLFLTVFLSKTPGKR